jgi:hypothetical protein
MLRIAAIELLMQTNIRLTRQRRDRAASRCESADLGSDLELRVTVKWTADDGILESCGAKLFRRAARTAIR